MLTPLGFVAEAAVTVGDGTGTGSIVIHSSAGAAATAAGSNAIAAGIGAQAGGQNSIAIGTQVKALGWHSMALGWDASIGENSGSAMALEYKARVGEKSAFAMFLGPKASIDSNSGYAMFLGPKASIDSNSGYAMALGYQARVGANSGYAVALGAAASIDANSPSAMSLGAGARVGVNSDAAVTLGYFARVGERSALAMSLGTGASISVNSGSAMALGGEARVDSNSGYAMALGYQARVGANSGYAVALGGRARILADTPDSVALGSDAVAHRRAPAAPITVHLGNDADVQATVKGKKGAVSVGNLTPGEKAHHFTRQITGVAAGTENSDAVNIAQLKAVEAKIAPAPDLTPINTTLAGHTATLADYGNKLVNHEDRIGTLEGVAGDVSAGTLVVGGKTYISDQGLNANAQKISNVATGTENTDAVNVAQLKTVVKGIDVLKTTVAGHESRIGTLESVAGDVSAGTAGAWHLDVNGTAVQTVKKDHRINVTAGANVVLTSNTDGTTATVTVATVDNPVFFGPITAGSLVVGGKTYISDQGLNANAQKISNVAAGMENSDAVNIAQLKAVEAKIAPVPDLSAINATLANHGGRITALESGSGSGGGIDGAWGLQVNGNAVQTVKNGGVVNFTAGNNIVLTGSGTDVTVATVDNPVFSGPVTAGSLVVGGKTYVSDQGLNANAQKITNVANGTEDSDAVNYGQLKAAMGTGGGDVSKINSRIDDVDERVSSVGALASAFSALLPMAFDEGNRTSFALGYGHYDGKNAFALGAMHYLSRDALLNVGAAISGSEKAFRVGASFRLGSSKGYETAQVTKGELQARAEVANMKEKMAEMEWNNQQAYDHIVQLTARLERLEKLNR